MTNYTRRNFLQAATAAIVYSAPLFMSDRLLASPFGLPIGLQLYSVREMLAKDYEGTLKQIAALGFQEVEAAGYFDHSPEQVKTAMWRPVSSVSVPTTPTRVSAKISIRSSPSIKTLGCNTSSAPFLISKTHPV